MKILTTSFTAISATFLLTACVNNELHSTSPVTLHNCAIQETIPGSKATGAFLTMKKTDDANLSLISAKVPSITPHVEIHEMLMDNGKMKMSQIKAFPLKKGDNIFQKGGYHIMLLNVKKAVKVGEEHELTLSFNDGSTQRCKAKVKSIQALTPKGMKMMKGKMHK